MNASDLMTLGEVADHFGVQVWRVRRLFDRGLYPEPDRVGQSRVIPAKDLPKVEAALKEAGYLK